MDRIFPLLFALYIAGAILVAILRKLRTGPSPLPPPVAFPEEQPRPFIEEGKPPAEARTLEVEPRRAQPGSVAPETPAVENPEPGLETSTVAAEVAEAAEREALVRPQAAPVEGGPAATAPVPARAPARRVAPRARAVAAAAVTRKAGLSPAEIRRAIIIAELLGPPRALRPFSPFPWNR